jgi:hypothetical protein
MLGAIQPDAMDDDTIELDAMLALANRELMFLSEHFCARQEISATPSGTEFLEALDIARLALLRIRREQAQTRAAQFDDDHSAIQNAMSAMQREQP